MKITHEQIDHLNSLKSHPGWIVLVSRIKEKIDEIQNEIDTFRLKKSTTTFNLTEITILRKSYLKEIIGFPEEMTESFK